VQRAVTGSWRITYVTDATGVRRPQHGGHVSASTFSFTSTCQVRCPKCRSSLWGREAERSEDCCLSLS